MCGPIKKSQPRLALTDQAKPSFAKKREMRGLLFCALLFSPKLTLVIIKALSRELVGNITLMPEAGRFEG